MVQNSICFAGYLRSNLIMFYAKFDVPLQITVAKFTQKRRVKFALSNLTKTNASNLAQISGQILQNKLQISLSFSCSILAATLLFVTFSISSLVAVIIASKLP